MVDMVEQAIVSRAAEALRRSDVELQALAAGVRAETYRRTAERQLCPCASVAQSTLRAAAVPERGTPSLEHAISCVMDGIRSGGTADLADNQYGEYRFNIDDDRLTVQNFNQQGRTNLAAYAILRDSRCRFARSLAEDTVNQRCPALSSAATLCSITPVPAHEQFMDAALPATAAREVPDVVQTDPAPTAGAPATAAGRVMTTATVTSARETSPQTEDWIQLAAPTVVATVALAPVVTTTMVATPVVTATALTETTATPQPGDGSQILEGEGRP